jgi:hypothetical protein
MAVVVVLPRIIFAACASELGMVGAMDRLEVAVQVLLAAELQRAADLLAGKPACAWGSEERTAGSDGA